MSTIGTFTKTGETYNGAIAMLALQARNVRFTPLENRMSDEAPSHRIHLGQIEIGAAWKRVSKEKGTEYLSVKLDDPNFKEPIYANLFADKEGEGYSLIWNRPGANNGD